MVYEFTIKNHDRGRYILSDIFHTEETMFVVFIYLLHLTKLVEINTKNKHMKQGSFCSFIDA